MSYLTAYQVISPVVMAIDGNTFKDAVKRFVKLNYNLNLSNIIITDQSRHMRANFNYFRQDGRNRVGINMYPIAYPFIPLNIENHT